MTPSGDPRRDRLRFRPSGVLVMRLPDTIARDDIPELCRYLGTLLLHDCRDLVLCDVEALAHPDVVAIDALARLQLTAQRLGSRIALTRVSNELKELVGLAGLHEVLPTPLESPLHPIGQPEEREVPGGIQEETDTADPAL